MPSRASASGDTRRSVQAVAMTRAASGGMTPASASASASARSKSSIARTNALGGQRLGERVAREAPADEVHVTALAR